MYPIRFIAAGTDQIEPQFTARRFHSCIRIPPGYRPFKWIGNPGVNLSVRHCIKQLEDHMNAFDHLISHNPDPRVGIAVFSHGIGERTIHMPVDARVYDVLEDEYLLDEDCKVAFYMADRRAKLLYLEAK